LGFLNSAEDGEAPKLEKYCQYRASTPYETHGVFLLEKNFSTYLFLTSRTRKFCVSGLVL
jgi:hypothetical protein